MFKVTPDPGVIEVNTQPTESWDDLVALTETLYEEARLCRLGTDKFELGWTTHGDRRRQSHGARWQDAERQSFLATSGFAWKSDCLLEQSSVTFLSVQQPFYRSHQSGASLDESRRDGVYELEIALQQLPPRDRYTPPWMVDRLFRDLLVDLTGNTHRSEICIDKLYSPDSSTGRLGLVELRGFEMPPHAQMSLAQQLLIRSVVATFLGIPLPPAACRIGSGALHDRFMLPHFVWRDLCDVLMSLAAVAFSLTPIGLPRTGSFAFPRSERSPIRTSR